MNTMPTPLARPAADTGALPATTRAGVRVRWR